LAIVDDITLLTDLTNRTLFVAASSSNTIGNSGTFTTLVPVSVPKSIGSTFFDALSAGEDVTVITLEAHGGSRGSASTTPLTTIGESITFAAPGAVLKLSDRAIT